MSRRTESPRFIIDASVVTKWHLRDEQYTEQADALLTEFRDGRVHLLAPDQIRYEVASAIRAALRTKRLRPEEGRAGCGGLSRLAYPHCTFRQPYLDSI